MLDQNPAGSSKQDVRAQSPVLIGGCGSSGTTLLRKIINQHPNIFCGPELSVLNKKRAYHLPFDELRQNLLRYLEGGLPTTAHLDIEYLPTSVDGENRQELRFFQNLDQLDTTPEHLAEIASQCSSFKELVDKFFQIIIIQHNKQRWAEKTPTNCYSIAEFLELYPKGSYIQVVRDGRDVVSSLVKRGWTPAAAVRRWMYDTAAGIPYRKHPRYFEIRYEDLVNSPVAAIGRLFQFLNEEPLPEEKSLLFGNPSPSKAEHQSWTLQPEQSISNRATGKWKADDYEHKSWIEKLFRYTRFSDNTSQYLGLSKGWNGNQILEYFGYTLSDQWDCRPAPDWVLFRHYLREKRGRNKPQGLEYFQVTIT